MDTKKREKKGSGWLWLLVFVSIAVIGGWKWVEYTSTRESERSQILSQLQREKGLLLLKLAKAERAASKGKKKEEEKKEITPLLIPAKKVATRSGNRAMAARSVTSGADLAEHIRSGGANASPQNYVEAMQRYHPEAKVADTAGLYSYLRDLEVVSCPQEVFYSLASVTQARGLGVWTRKFGVDELCLRDRNLNKVVASTRCGNVGAPVFVPQVAQVIPVPAPAPVVKEEVKEVKKSSFFDTLEDTGRWDSRTRTTTQERVVERREPTTVVVVQEQPRCGYGGYYDANCNRLYGYFPGTPDVYIQQPVYAQLPIDNTVGGRGGVVSPVVVPLPSVITLPVLIDNTVGGRGGVVTPVVQPRPSVITLPATTPTVSTVGPGVSTVGGGTIRPGVNTL